MTNYTIFTPDPLPIESITSVMRNFKNLPNHKPNFLTPRSALVSVLLSSLPVAGFAAGYNITQIPVPSQIEIPAGTTARPVCLSINELGQVACNLEIIQARRRTPIDRLAPITKILASYAYVWDSKTDALTLLSPVDSTTFDRANVITDTGFVGGSTTTFTDPLIGAIWSIGPNTSRLFGVGAITDMNNAGDYVQNNQLFVNNHGVIFAGENVQVHAINNVLHDTGQPQVMGRQDLAGLNISGIGLLYSDELFNPVPENPAYALTSSLSDYSVTGLSDNGNFVISGTPNTISALTALSCTVNNQCESYFSTVGFSGRGKQFIRLNSVDNAGHAVGTDGGFALFIDPPTADSPNGIRIDLNSQLPSESFSDFGWFLNEAIGINNNGEIIGVGQKGGEDVAFLLTPILNN